MEEQERLDEAFWEGYRKGDETAMDEALSHGASPDARNVRNATPLLMATANGDVKWVKWLLSRGASPNIVDQMGDSPLLRAARQGNEELSNLLIEAGANPNIRNNLGATPLMEAATKGATNVCLALLKAGGDPNAKSTNGTTPLMNAAARKRVAILKAFLEAGGNPNETDSYGTAALIAASWGSSLDDDPEAARAAEKAARRNEKDEPVPFEERIKHNWSHACVSMLIEAGADPNRKAKSGTTAVASAALSGNWDVVELLVKKGANPNVRTVEGIYGGWTPLMLAIATGETETAKFLMDNGADLSMKAPNGQGPLEIAMSISYGKEPKKGKEMVEELLSRGAEAKGKTTEAQGGVSLWHMAVSSGDEALFEKASAGKADVNDKDHEGHTPLHYAVIMRKEKAVERLLAEGAEIDAKDKAGFTPLNLLALNPKPPAITLALRQTVDEKRKELILKKLDESNERLARRLVSAGADVNSQNEKGESPLCTAVRALGNGQQKEEFIDVLLSMSAKVGVRNENSDHAAVLAAKMGLTDLMEKLFKGLSDDEKRTFVVDCAWTAPEHFSIMEGFGKALKRSMELGSDIETRDAEGQTALVVAAATNQEDLVEILIQLGAKIDGTNEFGETPLHHAISANAPNVARILMKAGADSRVKDEEGRDAWSVAFSKGRSTCLEILREEERRVELELPSRFKL